MNTDNFTSRLMTPARSEERSGRANSDDANAARKTTPTTSVRLTSSAEAKIGSR